MLEQDPEILLRFVERAIESFDTNAHHSRNYINFKCNCCGENNRRDKKAYVLKNSYKHNDRITIYCHKASCVLNSGKSGQNWLKEFFPQMYSEYRRESFLNFCEKSPKKQTVKYVEKKIEEKDDVKFFVPILKGEGELFQTAIEYCVSRKLSENVWKKFFVATGGFFQGRLIIPFLDAEDKIYYYQGRTLLNSKPKYLNRRVGDKAIYNIFNIDKSLPVIIVEGPIDSSFVKNSIAIVGLIGKRMSENVYEQIKDLKKFYMLDNDEEGKKNSIQLLQNGERVFNWTRFLKDHEIVGKIKDVNDFILASGKEFLEFKDLEKYFTNDYIDVIYFK
ncbi:MAG TPA: hypothetical protein PLH46_05965 [Caldisericia bacterium]|nr:hypothetical protein [Caldisericia bacterium]